MSQKIKTSVEIDGSLTANSIVKSGGTASQILAADGSVVTAGSGVTISGGTISASGSAGVLSFNTRTGAVTLTSGDVTAALGYTPYNASNPAGYISSYTETDTLASVTSRGATTTSNISTGTISTLLGGGINLRNSANTANVGGFSRRGSWEGNSNYDPAIWAETGYGLYFYTDGSATTKMSLSTAGNLTVSGTTTGSRFNNIVIGSGTYKNTISLNGDSNLNISTPSGAVFFDTYAEANGSFRAPIFYDSNNTAYYGDFAGTSRINSAQADYIGVGQAINTSYRIIADGSIYLNSNGNGWAEGVWKQRRSGGTFYDVLDTGNISSYAVPLSRTITINGTSYDLSANRSWTVTTSETDTLATVTGRGSTTSTGVGFNNYVNILGQNSVYWYNSSNTSYARTYFDGGTFNLDKSLWVTANIYGDIFYDRNNTAYYLNPNGQSIFGSGDQYVLRLEHTTAQGNFVDALYVQNNESGGRVQIGMSANGTDGQHHRASLRAYKGSGNYEGTFGIALRQADTSHVQRLTLTAPGDLTVDSSMRAPIFYDSDNTGYYWNPNTTSAHRFQTPSGYLDMGSMNGSWCHFETDRPSFYFGSGVHVNGKFQIYGTSTYLDSGRVQAPIFYDSNDNNYYVDPDSTSVISTLKTARGIKDVSNVRILMPEGGSYVTTTSTITGAIRILLPTQGSSMMMTCTVKVYEYSTNKSFTITFGGHRDGANWYNEFCYMDGGENRNNLTVRFGLDSGKDCVYIGETNTVWSYPQVFVTDVELGYTGYNTTWESGWSVGFVTAFSGVTRTQTAYRKLTTSNYSSYALPLSGGTMTGQIYTPTAGTGVYDGAIQIRETGYVLATQYDWGYAPAMTFHWGNRFVKKFGARSDGQFAVDDVPIVLANGGTWGININGNAGSATQIYQDNEPSAGTYRLLLGNASDANGYAYNFNSLYYNSSTSTIQGANISGNAATATNADKVDGYHADDLTLYKSQTIDMSNTAVYSTSNYYPVTIPLSTAASTIQIQNNLNSNVPSWSTHTSGFTLNLTWTSNGSGWGTTEVKRKVTQYHERFANTTICGGITQLINSSVEVVWLRGGGIYYFKFSRDSTATANSGTYTASGQSVSPTSYAQNSVWDSAAGTELYYATSVIASNSTYSPTYYDNNDSAYFLDLNTTGKSAKIGGYLETYASANKAVLVGNWNGANYWGFGSNGAHTMQIDMVNADATTFLGASDINLKLGTNTVWHTGNDGSGSGLDADLLDGYHASYFATSSHTHDLGRYSLRAPSVIDALTTSNFRSTLFGSSANDYNISTARFNNAPTPLNGLTSYGTMMAWAGSDTHGFISVNYDTPGAIVGGGNGESINWTKKLAFADGTSASGTWGISITGNADTVDNYHASSPASPYTIPLRNGNGYLAPGSWIQLDGDYGLYSPNNGAHFYPNTGSYGSWLVRGSRNGWGGLEFDYGSAGNISLMISGDSQTVGFHNNTSGWQVRWNSGRLWSGRSATGGNETMVLQEDSWTNQKYFGSGGEIYATQIIDSVNTAFYFDGNNTGDSIRVAGDIVAYYSDERLKDRKGNIENALEKVLSLNGFYYTPNAKAQELGYEYKEEVGVSAQEVEAILPELIKDAPIGQGYKTLNYGKLTPLLIEAIKEQNTELNNLKAELLELKELVNKLINK